MWTCSKCGELLEDQFDSCWNCGTSCDGSTLHKAFSEQVKESTASQAQKRYTGIILTTAPALSGYDITETIEIITSEYAVGINAFGDFFSGLTDILGGRDGTTQNALRKARKLCLEELRKEADLVGANAVIAVDLDYSELTGKGKSMLFLVASGTAVVANKRPEVAAP